MATDKLMNHSQGESIITNLGTIATNLQNVTAISPAKFGMGYAVCDTAAGTAAKTANIANYVLTEGALVTVKFTNANTASNATLNLNNTGAKPILYKGSALTTDIISAGDICTFIYSTANSGSYNIINVDALSGAGAGTVKSVGAEGGLTTDQTSGAAISTTGNVKLNLKSNTAFTATAPDPVEIENKIYPVALDASGHPAVSVPGTTYTEGDGIDITNNVITNAGVTAVAPSDSSTGTDGTISVTTNGTTAEVAVKGLSDAAYKGVVTSIPASGATNDNVPTTQAVSSGLNTKLDATANAVSAAKLNTGSADYEVGSATKGVYFDDGIPKAMTYSVNTDVPADAVFTDTTYTKAANSAISVDNTNHTIDVATASTTSKGVVQLSTTLPASTATEDNKVPTALTVAQAIAALPEPMVFKGTVNGTYPATPSVGDTYKATANSTTGVTPAYKMGDTVIYSEPSIGTFEWVVIPSGDEPSGTVTGITGSDGIVTLDSTTSSPTISTSGTAKLALVTNHTTTVNAGNATSTTNRSYPVAIDGNSKLAVNVPWENTTYANGSGITIGSGNAINHSNSVTASGDTAAALKVKYDAQGHITGSAALTAGDIGLGNVGNFLAVSTAANQGLDTAQQQNARNNINIASSATTVKSATTNNTVVNGMSTSSASGKNFYTYSAANERLTINFQSYTTGSAIGTTDVSVYAVKA